MLIPRIASIQTPAQAAEALADSRHETVVVYKHSPTCSLSASAQLEFEDFARDAGEGVRLLQVDVLSARAASQKLEELTGVRHESPQILILRDGVSVWNASHTRVRASTLRERLAALKASEGTR